MEKQNITLSIRKDILQKAELLAEKQGTSVSALLSNLLEDFVAHEEGYQTARRHYSRLLNQELDLGTGGSIDWNREEMHARS